MHPPQPKVVLRDFETGKWLYFTSPCRILIARRINEVIPQLCEVFDATQKMGLHAAGFISYEAAPAFDSCLPAKTGDAFPLLWFGLFHKPDERHTLPDRTAGDPLSLEWQPSVTQDEYHRGFNSIQEYICKGDTYQVNFSYRLRTRTRIDPWDFFIRMMENHQEPCAAFVDTGGWTACSASPELFFRLDGDHIESRPMKGTAARGLWYEDDCMRAEILRSSEKEQAENVMITDMVRNDLGRIAIDGTVHVPALLSIEKHPSVWQMTSAVHAKTNAPLDQIFRAIFPPASITGAPKRRSMEIIHELESSPRRIYTGTIGFVAPDRRAQFNVAIRTALFRRTDGHAEYGVGGGIVSDSIVTNEFEECSIKAGVLRSRMPDFDLIETMQWSPEMGFSLLEYHLRRLVQSADYFGFSLNLPQIKEKLESLAANLPMAPHRIRLLASRTGDFRCETIPVDSGAMHFDDIPLAKTPVNSKDVFLYHKTTHRHIYEDMIRSCPGSKDVLMYNEVGEITESTVANVAFKLDGILYTPPLCCGLLPGTYRAWLLDRCEVQERAITIDEALRNRNVYLMNSVRGMQKVRIIASEDKGRWEGSIGGGQNKNPCTPRWIGKS